MLLTDVFVLDDQQGLRNIAWNPETRRSDSTFHYYTGVEPEDINGDGLVEVPVARTVAAYGESSVDQFWWLDWIHYQTDGTQTVMTTTYHSGDGWYLDIPAAWNQVGDITMCQQESSTIGGAQRHVCPGRPGRGEHPGALFGDLLPDRQRPQPPSGPKRPVHPL